MNEHPSPEFEKELRETFNAPEANPAFVRDLRATLLERSTMKTQTRSFRRMAWAFALAILILGLMIASPRVVDALKRIFGYVPGLGYVEQETTLRLLSAPVAIEKDGLKITVEKGVTDSQRTVLLEYIEGYKSDPYLSEYCDMPARLVLPDGRVLSETRYEASMEGGKGSPSGAYFARYVFEAMPPGQLEATLEIPCVMYDPNVRDFKFLLHFEFADLTRDVIPVIVLPTESVPAESGTVQTQPTTAPPTSSESTLEGFSIVLESETPLADGYILSGSYQWTDPRFDVNSVQINDPKFTDANGSDVTIETVEPPTSIDPSVRKLPFAYQIHGRDYAWPLTITVNSITVNLPDQGTFQFDAGANPQVGQTWDVNIDVPVAGHIIHVQTIQLTAGRTPTELGFTFTLTSDPEVMGVSVSDAAPIIIGNGAGGGSGGGGGGGNAEATGPIIYGWALEGYSPGGVKTFVISNLATMVHGTWQVPWQPSTK